jgi:hypothetical protein
LLTESKNGRRTAYSIAGREIMAQYWDLMHTSSDGPGAAAIERRYAFYVPPSNISGVNSLVNFGFMIEATPSGAALPNGTLGHAVKRYQVLVDGKPLLDYVNPLSTTDPDATGPNDFDYYVQKAGGTVVQLPRGQTAALTYIQHLPMGIPLQSYSQRIEVVVNYDVFDNAAGFWNAGVTTSAFKISMLAMYGQASESIQIGSAKTYTHSANSTETVVVSGNAPAGALAGVIVFNDTQADELGTDGIKAQLGGNYQLPLDLIEVLNGDARGMGALHVPDITNTDRTVAPTSYGGLAGATFINTYNLTPGANLNLVIQSSAATTRYYYPVFVKALSGPASKVPKQGVTKKVKPTQTILDDSGQS